MATAIRTIGHEDRLSLVDHLDELRTRLIVCAVVLGVAFGLCFWQNHALLHLVNRPLAHQTRKQVAKGEGPLGQTALAQQGVLGVAAAARQGFQTLQADPKLSSATRAALQRINAQLTQAVAKVPRAAVGDKPVTLGVGEPFTTTITITFYFALIFSLPIILWQLYGFVLPAFSPGERRLATPLMAAIPLLFLAGVTFGYEVVLPAAVRFLQNFNSNEFNVLVQANQYYKFAAITLLAMGLVFQVPVGILAATRIGIVTPAQLRKNRRYAIVVAAVIAALLPADFFTMLLEMAPLVVLYEVSVLIASLIARNERRRAAREATVDSMSASPTAPAGAPEDEPGGQDDPQVRQIIDHTDENLSG
jgi:sec-independent protein translocase protein TatC